MGRHKKEENQQVSTTDKIGFEIYSGQGLQEDFILRQFNRVRESIERQKAELIRDGTPANVVNQYLNYFKTSQEEHLRENFLPQIQVPDGEPGQIWYDIPILRAAAKLKSSTLEQLTFKTYPAVRITGLQRCVTANGDEYLVRQASVYGLNFYGMEVHKSIPSPDYYDTPIFRMEKVPIESDKPNPKWAQVARMDGTKRVFLNK